MLKISHLDKKITIPLGTKVDIDPKLWNVTAGKLVGKTQEVINTNSVLDSIKATMTKIYRELLEREISVTPERIKNIFLGVEIQQQMLLDLFRKHNEDVEKLIGINKRRLLIKSMKLQESI